MRKATLPKMEDSIVSGAWGACRRTGGKESRMVRRVKVIRRIGEVEEAKPVEGIGKWMRFM